jgi:Ca2+-binding RTX toxin-like protein
MATIFGDDAGNIITGTTTSDLISGRGGDDSLAGLAGDDTVDGGDGDDTMAGGTGNDSYVVGSATDMVIEAGGAGIDTVTASIGYTLGANLENLVLSSLAGNIDGTGNTLDNIITGNDWNNVLMGLAGNDKISAGAGMDQLDGGVGVDTMAGGQDNDIYVVDNALDVASENLNEGIDTVRSSVSYTLGANVENLVLTGSAAINGTGSADDNSITGNSGNNALSGMGGNDTLMGLAGNDTLNGGTGMDSMAGGTGDDTYVVDDSADIVAENAGEGLDTVFSSITHTLAANVENLVLAGMANVNGSGNGLNNSLTGNTGNNLLSGLDGADTLAGMAGNDGLSGGTGNDRLDGGDGNDILVGGVGADTLMGGNGDDLYNGVEAGDVVMETGTGIDRVITALASYTLGANLENLTLSGVGQTAIGNQLNNMIQANVGNNVLRGMAGNDTLLGAELGDDTLDGGTGADRMQGDAGNDTYIVDNAGDMAVEDDINNGIDTLLSSVNFTLGFGLDNLTLTGAGGLNGIGNELSNVVTGNTGANRLMGLDGADTLLGLAGNDTLDGGTGMDSTAGGTGDDSYVIDDAGDVVAENLNEGKDTVLSAISYTLGANLENLTLTGVTNLSGTGNEAANVITGNGGANVLRGNGGNDTLSGGAGEDNLIGGIGADLMAGGADSDVYSVDNAGDKVTELAGGGLMDEITAQVSYTIAANVERLTVSGTGLTATGSTAGETLASVTGGVVNGSNMLRGLAGNDTLLGGGFADTLDGGVGADSMVGGADNNLFFVDNVGDIVVEGVGNGIDTVQSSISHTLAANVENLTLTGLMAINGTGNELANMIVGNGGKNALSGMDGDDTLTGGAGNDTLTGGAGMDLLDGGTGMDSMAGGAGDDTYVVDSAMDAVTETAMDSGIDTVRSSVNYTLGANLENLVLTGMAMSGTGNALNNIITGNSAANTIDGGMGMDTLSGGQGNDVYLVDDPQDIVLENLGEGIDTVRSSAISYSLLANVENLTLIGSAVGGSGNELDNVLTGNAQDNAFQGFDGNDTIFGGDGKDSIFAGNGNDSLDGGNGNDFLNGEAGADKMSGGAGNDSYVVENAGDVVIEAMNGGTDEVLSLISYTLADNVENLTLIGSGLTGTGNALANIISSSGDNLLQGLAGNDALIGSGDKETLDGGVGIDSMSGGLGNDTYIVDNALDIVTEGMAGGIDTVRSSAASYTLAANVENLTLSGSGNINGTGNELANAVNGNVGNNVLSGLAGDDTLIGGAGTDTLTGGMGSDRFDFNLFDGSVDVVTDFIGGMGGDVVDVADLLVGFDPLTSILDNFVRFVGDGAGNTRVQVNSDGAGSDFIDVALLQGVAGLTAAQALANGNLDVTPDLMA